MQSDSFLGEKPFNCTSCEARFAQKCQLVYHCRMHHGEEKPHKCDFCGAAFATSSNLKIHIRYAQCNSCTIFKLNLIKFERNYTCIWFCSQQGIDSNLVCFPKTSLFLSIFNIIINYYHYYFQRQYIVVTDIFQSSRFVL